MRDNADLRPGQALGNPSFGWLSSILPAFRQCAWLRWIFQHASSHL